MSSTSTYAVWKGIRRRCNMPNATAYESYGGRGIRVCPEWDSFPKFLSDMGERPEGMTLDRIDNNGGYTKENCRWATGIEQQANTRVSLPHVDYDNRSQSISDWCRELGLSYTKVKNRIRHSGWTAERAFTTP